MTIFRMTLFPSLPRKRVSLFGGQLQGRLFRISFSGELAYELAVPAGYGESVADALMEAGKPEGIMPYGVEALSVLRVEKGHVTHNEINGTVVPGRSRLRQDGVRHQGGFRRQGDAAAAKGCQPATGQIWSALSRSIKTIASAPAPIFWRRTPLRHWGERSGLCHLQRFLSPSRIDHRPCPREGRGHTGMARRSSCGMAFATNIPPRACAIRFSSIPRTRSSMPDQTLDFKSGFQPTLRPVLGAKKAFVSNMITLSALQEGTIIHVLGRTHRACGGRPPARNGQG